MLFYATLKRHKIKLITTFQTQLANPAAFKTFLNTKDKDSDRLGFKLGTHPFLAM